MKQLEHLVIEPQNSATSTLIWLHGLGADGEDFKSFAKELDCDMLVLRSCSGGIARDRPSTPQRSCHGVGDGRRTQARIACAALDRENGVIQWRDRQAALRVNQRGSP